MKLMITRFISTFTRSVSISVLVSVLFSPFVVTWGVSSPSVRPSPVVPRSVPTLPPDPCQAPVQKGSTLTSDTRCLFFMAQFKRAPS